jgi:hypothetical protein
MHRVWRFLLRCAEGGPSFFCSRVDGGGHCYQHDLGLLALSLVSYCQHFQGVPSVNPGHCRQNVGIHHHVIKLPFAVRLLRILGFRQTCSSERKYRSLK